MNNQNIYYLNNSYETIDDCFGTGHHNIMVVCGNSVKGLNVRSYLDQLESRYHITYFSDFTPNPDYSSVVKGVKQFNENKCDIIWAIGGGSATDVAKCIKLFAPLNPNKSYLKQSHNHIKYTTALWAMPTTSGSGAESTPFAVIYKDGEKLSISDSVCLPSHVFLDASVLDTLPLYQKKCTMMDAFFHAVESYWAIQSTDESKKLAARAIDLIINSRDSYLANEPAGNNKMLTAANLAGQAIAITKTTAGHAMSYKLTTLYGLPHGHSVSLCVRELLPYMVANTDKCTDSRGSAYLSDMFNELSTVMGCSDPKGLSAYVESFVDSLGLPSLQIPESDLKQLSSSVNQERLKNNPVALSQNIIRQLYKQMSR